MAKFIINEPKLTREEWLREKFNALRPIHTLEKFFALRFKKNKSEEMVNCFHLWDGVKFEVQENWRSCIFEDLEDGQYYYIPQNEEYNLHVCGGYGFCLSEILQQYCEINDYPPYEQKCYRGDPYPIPIKTTHKGTFYDLMFGNSQNLDELFDTLAWGKKTIQISVIKEIPIRYDKSRDCMKYQLIYSYDIVNS